MMYVQVNVGRNVGNVEMDEQRWRDFRSAVAMALDVAVDSAYTIESHQGWGVWDGKVEESAHLSVFTPGSLPDGHTRALRNALADLATIYGQDSVALIVADSQLITPATVEASPGFEARS